MNRTNLGLIVAFVLTVMFGGAALGTETVTLYDNLVLDFLPDRMTGPGYSHELFAQPFWTGDYDNVSAVTINLFGSRGNPTGQASIEIWDDDGSGHPGRLIGVVGTIDLASLPNGWAFQTFDQPVTGLTPQSRYFVLLNFTAANIDNNNSAGVATYESSLGTKGADLFLSGSTQSGSTWQPTNTYFTGNFWSYMEMAVMSAVTTVDYTGDGIVDSADVSLMVEHWHTDNPLYDIAPAPLGDGFVDVQDLVALSEYLTQDVSDPTLVAHWALDEAEGDVAQDSAGDNIGLLVGGPVWQPAGGQVSGALQFDGIDDVVVAGPTLDPASGPFSVLAWIKGGAAGQTVISEPGGVNWLGLDPLNGFLMTELKDTGRSGVPLLSETTITDGQWHRIGFVWDGSNRTLYVDGIVVAQDTQDSLGGSQGGLSIGTGNAMAPGTYFSGLIDDVRIYNRAVRP